MRRASLVIANVALSIFFASSVPGAESAALRSPVAFANIGDVKLRSIALFQEAGKVMRHPRCLNCHPASDRPNQTDQMRPHQPLVLRGASGTGAPGMPCTTCHHNANFDAAHVPGHPLWHLAPLSMAWEGRSLAEICAQIKDRSRNGGRDVAAIVRHMSEDSLVGWAWSPGASRTPAPGSQRELAALLKAWIESGAECPAS